MDPHYTVDDLLIITVGELRDRVGKLPSARTQQIARELWRRLDQACSVREPWPRRFLQDKRSLFALAGPLGRPLLLELLRLLRTVNFNRILDSIATGRGASASILGPAAAPRGKEHISMQSAEVMHEQLESILAGRRRRPFRLRRNWICGSLLGLIALSLMLHLDWLGRQFALEWWRVPVMILLAGCAWSIWYRLTFWVREKMRILALYMAYTEIFIDQQR